MEKENNKTNQERTMDTKDLYLSRIINDGLSFAKINEPAAIEAAGYKNIGRNTFAKYVTLNKASIIAETKRQAALGVLWPLLNACVELENNKSYKIGLMMESNKVDSLYKIVARFGMETLKSWLEEIK
jgi:hypothetical protein